mmetsp:Transcript_15191/g.22794  ORF Transcript_15191/g.22794 Transcript_15191/m.22794 type:complete len:560 (-) Transcript_15191:128-1807(-)
MKIIALSLLFHCAIETTGVKRFQASSERDGVLEVDKENWDERIGSAEIALVVFSAPWCRHCQNLAPEYAAAAGMVPEIKFCHVDATEETAELIARYQVRGYPHIKLFRHGNFSQDYEGPYTALAIANWIRRKSAPAVHLLKNWTNARIFFHVDDDDQENENIVRAIAVCENDTELKTWISMLEAVAKYVDDESIQLAVTLDPKLAGEEEYGLFLYSPYLVDDDTNRVLFNPKQTNDDSTKVDTIVRALEAATAPAITIYDAYTSATIFKRGPAIHSALFCDPSEDENTIAAFEIAAMQRRDRARHVIIPSSEQRVLEHFDIDPNAELPTLLLIDLRGKRANNTRDTRTYRYEPRRFGPISESKNILAFEDALLFADETNITLTPFLRSEPHDIRYPNPQNFRDFSRQGQVLILTGLTFESIVQISRSNRKDNTDFLVSFHAPWCSHSKALSAHLETIAEHFKAIDSLIIASLDATKNEVLLPGKGLAIQGFPTLVFFPADLRKDHLVYTGERDYTSIIAFIQKHATNALLVSANGEIDTSSTRAATVKQQQRTTPPPDL